MMLAFVNLLSMSVKSCLKFQRMAGLRKSSSMSAETYFLYVEMAGLGKIH
jgi:hypothetical protein